MTTLRVVIDDMLDRSDRPVSNYTSHLARALVESAPRDCFVEGIVSASTEAEYEEIRNRVPGLSGLYKSALSRRELLRAWQHGFTTTPSRGLVHGTSLFAPMRRHDRLNAEDQIVVTIHDALAWTAPGSTTSRASSWFRSMARRAQKYADAVVVPTHNLAEELGGYIEFGDRIRVIPPGATRPAAAAGDRDTLAPAPSLPADYLLTPATLDPGRGLDSLLQALTTLDIPLVVVGAAANHAVKLNARLLELGIPESRVLSLPALSDADYATVLLGAAAFVDPAEFAGPAGPILEAMSSGTAIVAADRPDLRELAAEGAMLVTLEPNGQYPEALGASLKHVLGDDQERARLSLLGQDRSKVFTWTGAAEKVWQLHADL